MDSARGPRIDHRSTNGVGSSSWARSDVATAETARHLRTTMAEWLETQPVGDLRNDIVLAMYEAVANSVEHAYDGAEPGPVTVTATPDWSIGITADSARRALEVSGHAIAGTSAVLLLAVTTPMIDILSGLRRLRVPQACIDVAAVMYRFLFVLLSSVRTIRQSQTARLGYSSPRKSLHSAGLLTAAVLIKSWDRASRLEAGLAGREFGDAVSADPVDRQRSSPTFLVAVAAVLAAVVVLSLVGSRG